MKKKNYSIKTFTLLLFSLMPLSSGAWEHKAEEQDTTTVDVESKKKGSPFLRTLTAPLRWIGRNWTAYDPAYSTPSFYWWAFHVQNNTSCEWFNIGYDGVSFNMRSKVSNKIGPYLSYAFIGQGYTIDINAMKGTKRRNEFTLSINSNLMNIDLIRRRTGGDFMVTDMSIIGLDNREVLLSDFAENYKVGDDVKYDVTGININYFTNHKRYSNPAAFSNGAIQLRSVGSPIIGLGYTHQKVSNFIPNHFLDIAAQQEGFPSFDGSKEVMDKMFIDDEGTINLTSTALAQIIMPTEASINDYHLQLGYAYNVAFSRRLLLGMSLVVSPGIKVMKSNNHASFQYIYREEISRRYDKYLPFIKELIAMDEIKIHNKADRDYLLSLEHITPELYDHDSHSTNFGANAFGRLSLTYNHNRWRFGFNANANAFLFNKKAVMINNYYGSMLVYAGYCFGRKKQYRYNGENREAYITAALTKSQIEEMRDTMPKGNIGSASMLSASRTNYHTDIFDLNVEGCDLVRGPEGQYGYFEVSDGYITPGQDSERRVRPGMRYEVNSDGEIRFSVGHELSFRAGNWWKSQLTERQIPDKWYPEMLHYALRGTLTLYVRNHAFGTNKPVRLTIPDVCLNHGKEVKQFFQIGAKSFLSHSTASVMGKVGVNGRLTRIYIESKKRDNISDMYVYVQRASTTRWMSHLPDSRPISRVSMPGTHDAGSSSMPESSLASLGHTQNFPICEQLLDGIRAFDIRLKSDMKFGHTIKCRDGLDEEMEHIAQFMKENPKETLIFLVGSDENGAKWSEPMRQKFQNIIDKYSGLFLETFDATTPLGDVRGKILVIKRQQACPYGKLLTFRDNAVFTYNGFRVEDMYREHKTYRKIKLVEKHLREAYENTDPSLWYVTFNTIAWDPRHHKPYYTAWGGRNIRKPMNNSLKEVIDLKAYKNFGIVFLDFYNGHGDSNMVVQTIINSNYNLDDSKDFIPAGE